MKITTFCLKVPELHLIIQSSCYQKSLIMRIPSNNRNFLKQSLTHTKNLLSHVLFLELQQTRISHLPKSSKYLKTFFLVVLSCSLFDSIRLKESEVSQLLFSRKGCTRKCELGWCHLHLICRCLAFHRSQLSQCIYPWGGSRCLQCLISDLACKKSSILS